MEIFAEGLHKRFGDTQALDGVSLEVKGGRLVAVLGLNGAGKSTLLGALGGLVALDAGRVCFDGEAFDRKRMDMRKKVFFTPDAPFCFREKSVIQNVALFVRMYDREAEFDERAVAALMEEVELAGLADKRVGQLSRGQVWKVALVGAAAVKPEVWLVDEPFASGMDAFGLDAFKRVVRARVAEGGTVVYTTQLVELAAEFADEVVLLDKGKVRWMSSGDEVRRKLAANDGEVARWFHGLRKGGVE